VEQDEAEEDGHGIVEGAVAAALLEASAEDHAEDGDVEPEHEQGIEDGPQDAEVGAAMALLDGAHGELAEQVEVLPHERAKGGGWDGSRTDFGHKR
jgi:hypothetical protein